MPQLSADGYDLLDAIGWHRFLTLNQARVLRHDDTPKVYAGPTYDLLLLLQKASLVACGRVEARGVCVHFCTAEGLRLISPEHRRDYLPSENVAVGMDYRHTYCCNEIACAFVRAARERGDEFGAFSFEHERLLRPGKGYAQVCADGILQYTIVESHAAHFPSAIVEMDRTTMPVRIADRLRAYAEIRRKPTLWKRVLPDGWPPILYVISGDKGRPKAGERNWIGDKVQSAARCARLVAYVAKAAKDEKGLRDLDIRFCSLPALVEKGPFAAIWHHPAHEFSDTNRDGKCDECGDKRSSLAHRTEAVDWCSQLLQVLPGRQAGAR